MKRWAALALMALPVAAVADTLPVDFQCPMSGVDRPERARQNYILKCQGCHGARAEGNRSNTPPMAGTVSRFLAVPGGREFLGRVPGVATAALSDAELAELLNWSLFRFDAAHVPADFKPYTASEISKLRATPMRTETAAVRRALVGSMKTSPAKKQ